MADRDFHSMWFICVEYYLPMIYTYV